MSDNGENKVIKGKKKTRKSVHWTRMPPPIVFISPAIKHWVYNKWTGYHLHTTNWIYSNIILIKRVIIWASSWENRLFAYAKTKTQITKYLPKWWTNGRTHGRTDNCRRSFSPKMTKFKLWKKWQKLIWGLYPNVMHIFSPWQKQQ